MCHIKMGQYYKLDNDVKPSNKFSKFIFIFNFKNQILKR